MDEVKFFKAVETGWFNFMEYNQKVAPLVRKLDKFLETEQTFNTIKKFAKDHNKDREAILAALWIASSNAKYKSLLLMAMLDVTNDAKVIEDVKNKYSK